MFALKAGSRTSMGRNIAGMELKCEKFKHSGHYPRTENGSGSRHISLTEDCMALSLLKSEVVQRYL